MTNEEMQKYYSNLLIIQYHNKPKAVETIKALISLLPFEVLEDILYGFDIETATGKQLDIIGKYVGVSRYYSTRFLEYFIALLEYENLDDTALKSGLDTYDEQNNVGGLLQYSDILTKQAALDDDSFRFLIKLKIIINNGNMSYGYIEENLWNLLGDSIYVSNWGDMSMTFTVNDAYRSVFLLAYSQDLLPAPAGVKINYDFV